MAINNVIFELQQEVYEILSASNDLMSNIASIFYVKPQEVHVPYIVVQVDKVMNISCFGKTRYEVDIDVEIIGSERDNSNILESMGIIRDIVIESNFAMDNLELQGIICSKDEIIYGKNKFLSGKMQFTAVVEVV